MSKYTINLTKYDIICLQSYCIDKITKLHNRKIDIKDSLKDFNYNREHRSYGSLKAELRFIEKEIKYTSKLFKKINKSYLGGKQK